MERLSGTRRQSPRGPLKSLELQVRKVDPVPALTLSESKLEGGDRVHLPDLQLGDA